MLFFDILTVIGAICFIAWHAHKEYPGIVVRSILIILGIIAVCGLPQYIGRVIIQSEEVGDAALFSTVYIPFICAILYTIVSSWIDDHLN